MASIRTTTASPPSAAGRFAVDAQRRQFVLQLRHGMSLAPRQFNDPSIAFLRGLWEG